MIITGDTRKAYAREFLTLMDQLQRPLTDDIYHSFAERISEIDAELTMHQRGNLLDYDETYSGFGMPQSDSVPAHLSEIAKIINKAANFYVKEEHLGKESKALVENNVKAILSRYMQDAGLGKTDADYTLTHIQLQHSEWAKQPRCPF